MLFWRLKDRTYTVYHGCYDDLEGFTKRDICQFIREEEQDFSQGSIVFAPSLLHRYHEISGKDDSYMGCQCIIRKAMAFRNQLKKGLAGLKEDFDLPAFSINPDDLFFGKIRIGTDKGDPVLFILLVADTDDLCRNLLFFSDQDIYRKQIFAASPALLTDAEYLLDGELLSFVFIVNAGALFDHGNGI